MLVENSTQRQITTILMHTDSGGLYLLYSRYLGDGLYYSFGEGSYHIISESIATLEMKKSRVFVILMAMRT